MNQLARRRYKLEFDGFIPKSISCCQFDVYPSYIILADIEETTTSSVNQIVLVATKIVEEYVLDPYSVTFIHHCNAEQGIFGREDFHRVPIVWDKYNRTYELVSDGGHWPRLSREQVEEMIAQPYSYL